MSTSLLLLGLLPDHSIGVFIEWRTSGRELAEVVVLRAHQRGAITEGAANPLAIESAVVEQLPHEIGLRQRRSADAGDRLRQVRLEMIAWIGAPGAAQRQFMGTRLRVGGPGLHAVRDRIEDVDAHEDLEARNFGAYRADDVARQPRAILEAAAIGAGAV